MKDLRALTHFLDQKYRGPWGWRFGWDGLLGLVPILGDMVTNAMSVYIILRAAQIGCPPSVLIRMGLNLLTENLVDAIPFVGNLFDFFWKANTKNLNLVEAHLANPTRTQNSSRWLVGLVLVSIMALVLAALGLSIWALMAIVLELTR